MHGKYKADARLTSISGRIKKTKFYHPLMKKIIFIRIYSHENIWKFGHSIKCFSIYLN